MEENNKKESKMIKSQDLENMIEHADYLGFGYLGHNRRTDGSVKPTKRQD